ncbi:MAG: 2,3-bisphosphoglycerate-independent phosphoglycerate mutase [bacterium]|nr:2,3-bisphosphoglycerate-independent phosphoglycerate mutase [bacterium]
MVRPKPLVLVILDGWGIAPPGPGNAITQAATPNMTQLWNTYTHTQLIAHGESVGLPKKEPGNTEVGHLNLGAGRIVYQDLPRINMSIADGSFFQNPSLVSAIAHAKENQSQIHLMGLVGGGGVHSDLAHIFAILRLCKENLAAGSGPAPKVLLHLFTDGRDSPPTASLTYISQITQVLAREKLGQFASVCGRYYAMDRDFRWDRTAKAYFCLTQGVGKTAPTVEEAVKQAYAADQTDEFIEPTVIVQNGAPVGLVKDNDAVIFYNFRIDRPRQLTKAFTLVDFVGTANKSGFDPYAIKYLKTHNVESSPHSAPFDRGKQLTNLYFVTMTEYEKGLPVHIAFPPQVVDLSLGRVLSEAGLHQLRVAESEKERFVTYYFNGQVESAFSGEERLIVPSPKVPTYDQKPEMSAPQVTAQMIAEVNSGLYDFIVVNFANPDMVGHTGNIKAAIQACQVADTCVGQLATHIQAVGGVMVITADHGNVEEMINRTTGEVDTEHNANPVPLIIVGKDFQQARQLPQGILADVAPTLMHVLGIRPPSPMTGRNLLG